MLTSAAVPSAPPPPSAGSPSTRLLRALWVGLLLGGVVGGYGFGVVEAFASHRGGAHCWRGPP